MARTRFGERRRPRSVWFALAGGTGATALVALLVLVPVVSLVAASLGAEGLVAVVSLYPVVAVAAAVTDQAREIVPFVIRWIEEGAALLE